MIYVDGEVTADRKILIFDYKDLFMHEVKPLEKLCTRFF